MNPMLRLPAFAVNGIAVALGVGAVHGLITAAAGSHAAQLALAGAVCASLADVPNTVQRTWHRVSAAVLLSVLAAMVVASLKAHPVAMGAGVALIAFVAMMTMSWGARAGAVSFAPILSMVFAMAVPPQSATLWELAGWNAAGGAAYLAWSMASGWVLQRRLRTLALSDALRATAALLRARADLLASPAAGADEDAAMRAWVQGEALLADRLQTARDFVFAAPDTPAARRQSAILLRAIDLRDLLLASRLDLHLFGRDGAGQWALQRLSGALHRIGDAVDEAAEAVREGRQPAPPSLAGDAALFADAPLPDGDARVRLLPAVADRLRQLEGDVHGLHGLLSGDALPEASPLTPDQLRQFVAPEGWPLAALPPELSWHSPVGRHALRSALALAGAYALAQALPWASHPHWLVLSVAVVLRGSLEQTLSRRNARVLGTMLGCVVVLLIAFAHSAALLGVIFLVAVGIAHAFINQRYWLTASAATVMALLQTHLVDPSSGYAIGERVADTLLGALLAWGFSYVLPSWERRSLPGAVERGLKALGEYAGHVLTADAADAVTPRLARRRAYDALNALAAALQRSAAEPASVRVPVREMAMLLDHGQRLMAQLSSVRLILSRRGDELVGAPAAAPQALAAAHGELMRGLGLAGDPPVATVPVDLAPLPAVPPSDDVIPWLTRRLHLLVHDAGQVRIAAQDLLAAAARHR